VIPHLPTEGYGLMKRTFLLGATLPFGSILADAGKSKNANLTLDQHELPNVAGKSINGVVVEYSPLPTWHTHPKSAFTSAIVLDGAIRSQVNDGPVTIYEVGQGLFELPGGAAASAQCQ
jgi:quercetin dioxygenase-like cupin family protein